MLKKTLTERPRITGTFSNDEFIRFAELQIQPPVNVQVRHRDGMVTCNGSQLAKRLFQESSKLYQNAHLPFKICAQLAVYAQFARRVNLIRIELEDIRALGAS